jgi:ABC-2 type transport system permease protein
MAAIFAQGGAAGSDLTFAFIVTILQIVAIIAAVMGVQVVLHVYAEEIGDRAEPLLAGSLRRATYLASKRADRRRRARARAGRGRRRHRTGRRGR